MSVIYIKNQCIVCKAIIKIKVNNVKEDGGDEDEKEDEEIKFLT
jgi:hypothetical protein